MTPARKEQGPSAKIRLTDVDLVRGRLFTIQREGQEPRTIEFQGMVEGIDSKGRQRFEVEVVDLNQRQSRRYSYARFISGRAGHFRITEAESLEFIGEQNSAVSQDAHDLSYSEAIAEAVRRNIKNTPKVFLVPQDGEEGAVPAIVTKVETERAYLYTTGKGEEQLIEADTKTLLNGGELNGRRVDVVSVDPKFDIIFSPPKDKPEIDTRAADSKDCVRDINGKDIAPSQSCWIVIKDLAQGVLQARKAFFMGLQGEGLARFLIVREQQPTKEEDAKKDVIEQGLIPTEVINNRIGDILVGIIPFPKGAELQIGTH